MKKKTCDSGVSWDRASPPLGAVKKFKEVDDFLFQYSILGVRDDAWRLWGVGDWLLGSLRSLMRGYNWRRGVFEKWRPSSMLLAGYSGWPVLVAVVFPDGSECAEGGSKTFFFIRTHKPHSTWRKRSNPSKKNCKLVLWFRVMTTLLD